MFKPLPGLSRAANRSIKLSKLKNAQNFQIERIAGFHTSQKMDKFELAKKYHGLESNVW